MAITWKEITYDNLENLQSVFTMYDKLFPFEVREPHSVFLKGLRYAKHEARNPFRILAGVDDEKIVSFATGHYLFDLNWGFIVYIATDPCVRNKGLGSQTLRNMEELLNEDAHAVGKESLRAVILETEKPELVRTQAERADCMNRQRFFTRNGYELSNEIQYVQPPLHDGEEMVPLNLYIRNFLDGDLTVEETQDVVRAMYREKYRSVNGIDLKVLESCMEAMGIQGPLD